MAQPPTQRSCAARRRAHRTHPKIHTSHGGRVGVRRVRDELRRAGVVCSHKRVHRLMRTAGLRGVHPRPYKRTTDSGRFNPALADLLHRDWSPPEPDLAWVGDVTYIKTWTGWAYLATVIDCYSRRVVGFAIADHMRTDLIIEALRMAIIHRKSPVRHFPFRPRDSIRPTSSVTSAVPTAYAHRSDGPEYATTMLSPNRFSERLRRNSSTLGPGRLLTSSAPPCLNTSSRTITGVGGIRQSATTPRSNTRRNTRSHDYKPCNRVSTRSGTLHPTKRASWRWRAT
jgi:HTH-like domain/Integrase core domain